jgi:xanthine/CO dehydrogenase XdhC/CoxF family maturation factor
MRSILSRAKSNNKSKCQQQTIVLFRVVEFERIGAATKDGVTRACLQDMQVMRSIGDGDDESDMLQHAVQTGNNTAVYHLIQAGYDAQYLTDQKGTRERDGAEHSCSPACAREGKRSWWSLSCD